MNYKPTYIQLIDSIRSEFDGEDAERLSRKSDEAFQVHILEAEQRICDEYEVEEEYTLRIYQDVDEYLVNEHSPVISASNDEPISVNATNHGLSTGDVANLRFVRGNEAANGSFRISDTDDDNFALYDFARITGISEDNPAVFETEKNHGWSTGKVVTLVDTEAAFDGSRTITVTGLKTFTIPVDGADNEYESGGMAYAPSVGSGAYTSGGKFWKENEIPSHLWRFKDGLRASDGVVRSVRFVNNGRFIDNKNWEWTNYSPGNIYSPYFAVHLQRAGERLIKLWPIPSKDQDLTFSAVLRIDPTQHYDDPITANIHLQEEWSSIILHLLRSRAFAWLKDYKNRDMEMNEFERQFQNKKRTSDKQSTIKMVYG